MKKYDITNRVKKRVTIHAVFSCLQLYTVRTDYYAMRIPMPSLIFIHYYLLYINLFLLPIFLCAVTYEQQQQAISLRHARRPIYESTNELEDISNFEYTWFSDNYLASSHISTLHEAIIVQDYKAIERIIQNNPLAVHSKNCQGDTPLHVAMQQSNAKVILLLLKARADYYARNNQNITPLQIARNSKNKYLRRLLCKFIKLKRKVYKTSIYASLREKKVLATRSPLIQYLRNANGNTPLHQAIINNDIDFILYLVSKYPELIAVYNNHGHTPVWYAITYAQNNYAILRLLFKIAGDPLVFSTPKHAWPLPLLPVP